MKTGESKAKLVKGIRRSAGTPRPFVVASHLDFLHVLYAPPSQGLTLLSTWGRQRKGSQTGSCLSTGLLI